jgi:hypothetical protein
MKKDTEIEECMRQTFEKVEHFVTRATGIKPEPEEIARALSKYFVLKEVLEFIILERQENSDE